MKQVGCCYLCSQHPRFQEHDRIPTVCNTNYSSVTPRLHNQKRKSDHSVPGWWGDMSNICSSPSSWQEPHNAEKPHNASLTCTNGQIFEMPVLRLPVWFVCPRMRSSYHFTWELGMRAALAISWVCHLLKRALGASVCGLCRAGCTVFLLTAFSSGVKGPSGLLFQVQPPHSFHLKLLQHPGSLFLSHVMGGLPLFFPSLETI